MRAMRMVAGILFLLAGVCAAAADREPLTEADFRGALNVAPDVKLFYRNLDCSSVNFAEFSEAMQRSQERQERAMKQALESAERIRLRHEARSQLLERVNALGERARDINEPMAALSADAGDPANAQEVLSSVKEVSVRLDQVIEEAAALAAAAREADWVDIGRDADVLKQQLQAARNKLQLAERSAAARAPS